jgi:DNA-binding MurR/RpiR family transcriptional regulator
MNHESVSVEPADGTPAIGPAAGTAPDSQAMSIGDGGAVPAQDQGPLFPPGVSERIRQRLGALSVSERRVARVLLSGPPTAGLESSAKLAEHAGVSGPTISRFVTQQLGFQNYAAFQRALRDEISARVLSPVEVYREQIVEPASAGYTGRSGAILGEAVTASVQGLDPAEFARATALMCDTPHHVLAMGGAFSQLVAGYLVGVLREIRPGVRLVPPIPAERAAALADIGKKDVVGVFDFRRYERDTQDFASAAKAAGARIVLFTDPWLSPIADIADALLPAQVAAASPFPSLAATVAVVETLLTAVAGALGEDARAHFERFGDIADRWIRFWPETTRPADFNLPLAKPPRQRRRSGH